MFQHCGIPWLVLLLTVHRCNLAKQVEIANVALGKPTWQPTTAQSGHSSRAVDGNTNPDFGKGTCTHTSKFALYNFWIVDLLCSYRINTINITNRASCSERLSDFYIYVSEENPEPIPSTQDGNFKGELCLHHTTALPSGGPHSLQCESQEIRGRYVYLWKWGKLALTLCEFEVYAEKLRLWQIKMIIFPGRKSSKLPFFTYTMHSYSKVDCIAICLESDVGCTTVVQVEKDTNRCECIEENGLEESVLEIDDAGWTLMRS